MGTASPLWELSRRSQVAAWRAFNSSLDTVFYDVGALSVLRQPRLDHGHSKGNYSIENALEGWSGHPDAHLDIVTLGAVIWFPLEFANLQQFIGEIDYFGMLNSRIFVQRIGVPGAWHTLNTAMPGHLSVRGALEAVNGRGAFRSV